MPRCPYSRFAFIHGPQGPAIAGREIETQQWQYVRRWAPIDTVKAFAFRDGLLAAGAIMDAFYADDDDPSTWSPCHGT